MRFRQSQAKVLLTSCPAVLRWQLERYEYKQTRAMAAGSLLDYLTFEQDDRYEVVDARYASGDRSGQPCTDWTSKAARDARSEVESRGLLPVLESEISELRGKADAVRQRINDMACDWAGEYEFEVTCQSRIEWVSGLGLDCEGTPDVVVVVHRDAMNHIYTIDVKHTAAVNPKKLASQVHAMCWDVQAAAYAEGAVYWVEREWPEAAAYMGHWLLMTSPAEEGLPPCARQLSPVYLEIGKRRWERAQRIMQACLDSDTWPGYPETPVDPPLFVTRAELETYDFSEEEQEP